MGAREYLGCMSNHTARIAWQAAGQGSGYEQYSRDHRIEWGTGSSVSASAAPEYRGNPELPNPEELLVGALSSCHMLTFLAVCARKNTPVASYVDDATGVLERGENGRMQITRVTLRPRVEFAGEPPDRATLVQLHAQAHRGCFIANSVTTQVDVVLD